MNNVYNQAAFSVMPGKTITSSVGQGQRICVCQVYQADGESSELKLITNNVGNSAYDKR